MLESLIGHGIQCQGKDYEIVGVTGGDAYSIGGVGFRYWCWWNVAMAP